MLVLAVGVRSPAFASGEPGTAAAKADCASPTTRGRSPQTYYYLWQGEQPRSQWFQVFPCGQTVILDVGLWVGKEVAACPDDEGWRCFIDANKDGKRSVFFLALPPEFHGGELAWKKQGVKFQSRPVANDADLTLIEAHLVQGELHPLWQSFVYSRRDGLISAAIGRETHTRVFVLEKGKGLFAESD